ncbi:MAG: hypothetical protein ACXVCO_08860 [Ktedonobacterales bacterium]
MKIALALSFLMKHLAKDTEVVNLGFQTVYAPDGVASAENTLRLLCQH